MRALKPLPRRPTTGGCRSQQGVVLIEALLSILIFSIGILGIIGLQARMVQDSIHAQYRTDASYFASQAVSQQSVGSFDLTTWQDSVSAGLPNGSGSSSTSGNQLTVTVKWHLPDETVDHQVQVIAQLCANPTSTTCT